MGQHAGRASTAAESLGWSVRHQALITIVLCNLAAVRSRRGLFRLETATRRFFVSEIGPTPRHFSAANDLPPNGEQRLVQRDRRAGTRPVDANGFKWRIGDLNP